MFKNSGEGSLLIKGWHSLVHLGFRLLYHEFAWTYDSVSWLVSIGHWQEWGKETLPFIKGNKVLELAHGPGHLQLALSSAGFQAYGIDQSPQMSRLARRRIIKEKIFLNIVRGEAQNLPYCKLSFDTVVATFPTEFIVDSKTLKCIWRVLAPGGSLIVVVQGRLLGRGPIYRIIEWLFEVTGQRQAPGQDPRETEMWMEVDKRFEEAGFSMEVKTIRTEDSEVIIVAAEKVG